MYFHMKNLILLIVICYRDILCQEISEIEANDTLSEVICQKCNCTENNIDCSNKGLLEPFDLTDWEGLKTMNPISVDLSHNQLSLLTRLPSLPIQTFNLSNCELDYIEGATFAYLSELVTLDLSRNKLSTSSINKRVFVGLITSDNGLLLFDKMRYLSLAYNDIHSLPQDVFTFMSTLTTLDMSGNPLVYLDQLTMAALSDLVNLRELFLSSCELEFLPEGLFRRQRLLRRLDLSDNRFTTIPAVLNEANNLRYLNFGKNPIQVLETENVLRNLTKLEELRLCRNSKLTKISASALGGLVNLVSLHICYNPRLTTVDADFLVSLDDHDVEVWPVLSELYMNNNNLSRVDSGYLHRWDKLVRADFSNNPYQCDCNNKWVVDVLVPLLQGNISANMICAKPSDLRGLSFAQLYNTSRELTCPDNESIMDFPTPDLAVLLGVMIGIFVTFPLVLVIVLLWRKGYFQKCRSTKDVSDDEEMDAF